jgi:two-component system chemotaxis sensor kinase CheA
MNEFLQQFVLESRELMSQAVEGLLQLEHSPKDTEVLDGVFRAFHTLKGGAGIVEFAAMERTVHAAEEILGEVRANRRTVSPSLVSSCLASLDQVGRWLEMIAASGELPPADRDAEVTVERFSQLVEGGSTPADASSGHEDWVAPLLLRHAAGGDAATAIRYTPGVDCFFQGEDPAARIARLPQLLAQELEPASPWPSLSELDPYACNLVLKALCAASPESVRAHMQGCVGNYEIVEIKSRDRAGNTAEDRVRTLLTAQLALFADVDAAHSPGRIASAGRVAANVLSAAFRHEESRNLRQAADRSIAEGSAHALAHALEQLLSAAPAAPRVAAASSTSRPADATLRIEAARIDALVRLTGELTTAKNALAYTAAQTDWDRAAIIAAVNDRLAEFARLIDSLQHAVLALRVLPLRSVLQRFPRVLRDISTGLGKPVALKIEGDHTEADKTIVDMLFEPLLHALRNAIDHGIETPARRLEAGKPLVATIWIRARRESDRVIVEVEDDGGGVDLDRVREVALRRQIATPDALQAMSEPQIVDLIFAPGFSTASSVSELSGRGVGLDAVRAAIQRVAGQVTLTSRKGLGTTVRFSLPFSVMVTQVLTVEAGGQTFGVPLDALLETIRIPRERICAIGGGHVIVHRDRTMALIDLGRELNPGLVDEQGDSGDVTVMVASVSDEMIALRIDRVGERMEVILKPLEGLLAGSRGFSGTTLLGDGRVLLVLDLWDLLA